MNEELEKTPRIAVVIPCFNSADVLRRTLESLVSQTLPPTEVVLVDNGSTDHPEKITEDFVGKLPIRIVRFEERRGAPAARNRGAQEVSSPYVLFLDADISLDADALKTMSDILESHPEASFAYSDFYWGWKRFYGKEWDPIALRKLNWIHTSSLIRRKDLVPFDESLKKFQDWDLWLTMASQGKRGVWIPRTLFTVVERKAGMSKWLPSFMHRMTWPILSWMPREISRYREAEKIIRAKHRI